MKICTQEKCWFGVSFIPINYHKFILKKWKVGNGMDLNSWNLSTRCGHANEQEKQKHNFNDLLQHATTQRWF